MTTITNHQEKYYAIPSIIQPLDSLGYYSSFYFGGELNYGNILSYLRYNEFDRIVEGKDVKNQRFHKGKLVDYSEDEIGEDLTFPMDDLDKAIKALGTIRDSYNTGRLYSQGARVVLAGPSNAGKSSLFNLFLKEDRSIVSAQKGTTRDYIEALCTIGGIPVRLYDTAGFRSLSESEIEEEGIRRSRSLVEGADIIVYKIGRAHV